MGILEDLQGKVIRLSASLESGDLVKEVLVNHNEDILSLQKEQLLEGKRSNGDDIRPYYSEDLKPKGYFKTAESAKRYAVWKQGLKYPVNKSRKTDVPNLYVTGKFHDDLYVRYGAQAVSIEGSTQYGKDIVAKYGLQTFGLNVVNWNKLFFNFGAYNEVMNKVKTILQ